MWACLHTYVCVPHGFCLLIPFVFFSGACERMDKHTHHFYHVYPEVPTPTTLRSPSQNLTTSLPHLWSSPSPAKQPPSTSYNTPRLFSFPVPSDWTFSVCPRSLQPSPISQLRCHLLREIFLVSLLVGYLFLQWNENKNFVLYSVWFPKHLNQHLLPRRPSPNICQINIKWMNAFWTLRPSL